MSYQRLPPGSQTLREAVPSAPTGVAMTVAMMSSPKKYSSFQL